MKVPRQQLRAAAAHPKASLSSSAAAVTRKEKDEVLQDLMDQMGVTRTSVYFGPSRYHSNGLFTRKAVASGQVIAASPPCRSMLHHVHRA